MLDNLIFDNAIYCVIMKLERKVTIMNEEKRKALDSVFGQIEKQFGQGAVMRLGEKAEVNIEAIPTGSLALDIALGIGYTSQQSFTLAFKQMFGCTPNKYRSTYVVFERLECCYTSSKPNGSATIRLSQAYGRMAA